jgi:hypothetical protein
MSTLPSVQQVVFHADLSDAHPGESYWVRAANGNHPLVPHTDESRARARAADPRLHDVPDDRLTHYTEAVLMPTAGVSRVHIKHSANNIPGINAPAVASHAAIFVPTPPDERVAAGYSAERQETISNVTTAKALAFHHPDLITQEPTIASIILNYMNSNPFIANQFEQLGTLIRQMGKPATGSSGGWAELVPFTPEANPQTGVTGKQSFFLNPRQDYMTAAGPAMTNLLLLIKNNMALQGKKWSAQNGTSVVAAAAQPAPPAQATRSAGDHKPIARIDAAAATDDWQPALTHTGRVDGLQMQLVEINPATQQFSIEFTDYYIRYLGLYMRFFDAEGNTIDLKSIGWTPDGADGPLSVTHIIRECIGPMIEYDDLQFIGYMSGATTILGAPFIKGFERIAITMPANAVAAEVMGSGLGLAGTDTWPKTPIFGSVMTSLLDLVIPAFMLIGATAMESNAGLKALVNSLMKTKTFITIIVGGGIWYVGDAIYNTIYYRRIDWSFVATIGKLLFNKAAAELLLYCEAKMAMKEAEEEIPFAGWLMLALNISVGIAELSETIVEICTSPWNIKVGIATEITTTVTVNPDPRHQAFPVAPAGDTSTLVVNLIYKGGKRPTVSVRQTIPADFTGQTLTASFPNNILGGEFKLEAYYYIDNWGAAQASTGWMDNTEQNAASVVLYLVQNPIPIDADSIYVHTSLLTYQGDQYKWQPTASAPTATIADRDTSSSGNAISAWFGLALSQRFASLGFAWKAAGMGITSCSSGASGQLSAMQNIDIPGTPMIGTAFPACGFDAATRLAYDPYPPKFLMVEGNWVLNPTTETPIPDPLDHSLGDYYVDPSKAAVPLENGGGYHLRAISLSPPPVSFDMSSGQLSWARFAYYPDSISIHPSGAVAAVNTLNCKISITELQTDGAADDALPVAVDYAGQAFTTQRPGLLFSPIAVSCSYDGTFLVLESTKGGGSALTTIPAVARFQAFDVNGNPVNRFFDSTGNPTPFLPLQGVGDYTYLDLCAVGDEKMTYMYVLYYSGVGSAPSDYNVAIYQYGTTQPTSNPLVTTNGVSAANLFVDMWHTLYTLNFAMVTNGSGAPAGPVNGTTGPAGRTVPSASEWLPPIPTN